MTIDSIIAEIDSEIERLTQARALLSATGSTKSAPAPSRRGPKPSAAKKGGKRRTLSPEARKRIAEAQRRRWAAQKGKSKKES